VSPVHSTNRIVPWAVEAVLAQAAARMIVKENYPDPSELNEP